MELQKPINYKPDGTTHPSTAGFLGFFSSNAAELAGYGESTSSDVQIVNYEGETTTVSAAAEDVIESFDDTDIYEIAAQGQQRSIDFVSSYAKDYAFYDVKYTSDSSKAGFSDSAAYDNIRDSLSSLSVVWKELGKELTYNL